jgi:hypothetical protein
MFDGVGRRRHKSSKQLVNIGANSHNGNERDCLFRNNGDGSFTDVGYVDGADRKEDGRGLSILDYDVDGRPDVILRNYKQPAILLHNVLGDGHWIELKLVGTKSNRDSVGARITLHAGGSVQMREVHAGSGYLSGSSLIQHFGLGTHTKVESVEITWPSGSTTQLRDLAADRLLTIHEGETTARD